MLINSARTSGAPDAADTGPAPKRNPTRASPVEVTALRGWRDRNRFVDLPYRLHLNDPNWIPPLRRDMHRLLDRRKNPFFDHGEACFWLAWRDGIPVGRISAQINHLHLETHRDETGNFGLLEAIDDQAVFAALQGAAEKLAAGAWHASDIGSVQLVDERRHRRSGFRF